MVSSTIPQTLVLSLLFTTVLSVSFIFFNPLNLAFASLLTSSNSSHSTSSYLLPSNSPHSHLIHSHCQNYTNKPQQSTSCTSSSAIPLEYLIEQNSGSGSSSSGGSSSGSSGSSYIPSLDYNNFLTGLQNDQNAATLAGADLFRNAVGAKRRFLGKRKDLSCTFLPLLPFPLISLLPLPVCALNQAQCT
jgi:hypothetical protein